MYATDSFGRGRPKTDVRFDTVSLLTRRVRLSAANYDNVGVPSSSIRSGNNRLLTRYAIETEHLAKGANDTASLSIGLLRIFVD